MIARVVASYLVCALLVLSRGAMALPSPQGKCAYFASFSYVGHLLSTDSSVSEAAATGGPTPNTIFFAAYEDFEPGTQLQ